MTGYCTSYLNKEETRTAISWSAMSNNTAGGLQRISININSINGWHSLTQPTVEMLNKEFNQFTEGPRGRWWIDEHIWTLAEASTAMRLGMVMWQAVGKKKRPRKPALASRTNISHYQDPNNSITFGAHHHPHHHRTHTTTILSIKINTHPHTCTYILTYTHTQHTYTPT